MKSFTPLVVCALALVSLRPPLAQAQTIPRAEFPMPQAVRAEWLSLNGVWQFAETDNNSETEFLGGQDFPDRIVVPFCRESKLSGLERKGFVKNVWYRRAFERPTGWKSPRARLHVGASDYRTRVWLNGHFLGQHIGGGEPFWFDITRFLNDGQNTVVIHAYDDTRSGLQPTGKQAHSEKSQGCVYTRTTGIWQSVWLEGVGSSFLQDFRLEPDVKGSRLLLQAEVNGPCEGLTLRAVASAEGQTVGQAEVAADWRHNELVLPLSEKRLWSPESPFLYDLKLTLLRDGQPVDEVSSYFGLREVTIQGAAILLNGKAIFQRTVLDQGFYPEGIWTAPTDEALRHDIELSMAAGFNGARLHQKVFEPRFLYWADKLGYMVWGEFPNWGMSYDNPAVNVPMLNEWVEILRRDRNHPAIIGWCAFNETPESAGALQSAVINVTRAIDPSRPTIESSGGSHTIPNPDILDVHDYDQNPASFRKRWTDSFGPGLGLPARYRSGSSWRGLPFFLSEFGGIGWSIKGGWGYGIPKDLEGYYTRFQGLVDDLLDNRFIFGYCYTQLTDIEQEQNGVYFYNRQPKFDVARLHAIQARAAAYEKDPPLEVKIPMADWRVLVGAAPDGSWAQPWHYTLEKPAENWNNPDFADSDWKVGQGGFGHKPGSEAFIKTPWTTKDIWLRQDFGCDKPAFKHALLVTHHDDEAEIFVNGKPLWKGERWNDGYAGFDVTQSLREALKEGRNTIAIHCHQDEGGQFIDAALLVGDR